MSGQVPDKDIPDDGTVVQQTVLKRLAPAVHAAAGDRLPTAGHRLTWRCRTITPITPRMRTRFAKSTWIVQQADYDMMFKPGDIPIRTPDTYQELKDSKRITLHNEDHDVFGDGTRDHQDARPATRRATRCCSCKLAKFGPLLLAGDLYHLPEEKTLDRVPTFDFNADMTRATRKQVDEFVATTHATMWIQHNPATNATLKKSPEYYE